VQQVGTVDDLLVLRFGANTTPRINDQRTTIGTTAGTLVRQTPYRPSFFVVNLSVNQIWIGPFADVSSAKGVRLGPQGGFVRVLYEEDFSLVADEWFCIADVAASAILIVEQLIVAAMPSTIAAFPPTG